MADDYENDVPEGAVAVVPEEDPAPELGDLPYAYKLARKEKLERAEEARERHAEARDDDSGDTGESQDDATRTDDTYGTGERDF